MFCSSGHIPPLLASSAACQQIICLPAEIASHGKKLEEQNWLLASFLQADLAMRNNCCWQEMKSLASSTVCSSVSCQQKCKNAPVQDVSQHFNLAGHRLSDMRIRVLEKIHNKDPFYRKKREAMYINKFNTKLKGLNKISWTCCFANTFKNFFFILVMKSLEKEEHCNWFSPDVDNAKLSKYIASVESEFKIFQFGAFHSLMKFL